MKGRGIRIGRGALGKHLFESRVVTEHVFQLLAKALLGLRVQPRPNQRSYLRERERENERSHLIDPPESTHAPARPTRFSHP